MSKIGMKVKENKIGITGHNNIKIPLNLINKYPAINKDNLYKYLGLHIYEVNCKWNKW